MKNTTTLNYAATTEKIQNEFTPEDMVSCEYLRYNAFMNLERMLEKCRRDQWRIEDLDWSLCPPLLTKEKEIAVVQYFKDMSGIELLAAELFKTQRERTENPILRQIFSTFVADEIRHARVATRLAEFYNVHRYQAFCVNPYLRKFSKHFIDACHYLSPEIANAYITTGELLLDIALLRSLDDYVDDEMSHQAMRLINRDESRHIAVDYHMVEYYASEEYEEKLQTAPKKTLKEQAQSTWAFCGFLYYAKPFFRDVFFRPMDLTDPSGKRLKEAFKRSQLIGLKPRVAKRPFVRFMQTLQTLFNHPLSNRLLGPLLARVMGVEPRVIQTLYSEEEKHEILDMSFEQMAKEALNAKNIN